MINVSNEELTKIAQFIASCNDMINGKFILADIKITKILNMIANSTELYNYVKECLIDYDFSREYHRAEVKNRLNNGVFTVPNMPNTLVAFVFCLLVECDAKRIDFYNFINENFATVSRNDSYNNFANKLLVPFRDVIAAKFGMGGITEENLHSLTEQYKTELNGEQFFDNVNVTFQTNAVNQNNFSQPNQFANENSFENSQQNNFSNANNMYPHNQSNEFQSDYDKFNAANLINEFNGPTNQTNSQNYVDNFNTSEETPITKNVSNFNEEDKNGEKVWEDICSICRNLESAVYMERRIKPYLKEELIYIIKTIKYSTKYRDVKIISALVTAFDELAKKFRSVQFILNELKIKVESLY